MQAVEPLLAMLRAAAEPTRLRLLALVAHGAFCVTDLTEILHQSQPRLSRHLRLLCEAGLLTRVREGAQVWFALPSGDQAALARAFLARLSDSDPVLAADRRHAARVLSERARAASDSFRRRGADWDEMRALNLPAAAVEQAILDLLPAGGIDRLLDIGTGTGRLLELLGPRAAEGVGVDASKAMLALARARLSRAGLTHCAVRLGDMYRLPLADAGVDVALLHMVLHHADDPAAVLAEAGRVLRPGGLLVIVDLAAHDRADLAARLAHRWPGFSEPAMLDLLAGSGLQPAVGRLVSGLLDVRLWSARRPMPAVHQPATGSILHPALSF